MGKFMIMASMLFLLGALNHLNDVSKSKTSSSLGSKSSPRHFSNASLSSVAKNCLKLFIKVSEVITSSP